MGKTHKRKRGGVALCGDGRAKRIHNHWSEVDCKKCWSSRLPQKKDKCEHPGCTASTVRWVGMQGVCNSHAGDGDWDKTKGGIVHVEVPDDGGYGRMLDMMAGES